MRLLHFDTLGSLILTDFRGKAIPEYAILSHRWSSTEILLEDIASGAYKDKQEGYRKLEFCANQAAQDSLQYFWIDTCCIDTWDLRERSQAINSMFRWYRNAKRCYVFLSDVLLLTATNTPQRSDWEPSFCASEWFTRGWTLQELIAPVSVEFFSCEGQRIGDKTSLDQLIHKTTDIPLAALRNCPMEQFTTIERERWVERRKTTEEEDIIYCLLGVLGIYMPTSYGEGRESARRRLQDEVAAVGSAPSVIPFARNYHFVGQESNLAKVEAMLFSNKQTTTTLAISGPGGTGKSQLALEIAHMTRQNNKHCSVFWIDASDKGSLYQSYASVAQKLGVSGWDDDETGMEQLARHCVKAISMQQCLLIFDNADDTTLRSSGSSMTEDVDLADYVPHSHLCSVIFTTTSSNAAKTLAPQCMVVPQELTPSTARRMLQNHLARPLSDAERQETESLLEELSYLPLAVVQAAAYMNTNGMTVQEYRLRLNEHAELAPENSSDSSKDELQGIGLKDPVATTLFLSMDQISRDNEFAAGYLFLAACLDRKDIPLVLLEASSLQAREYAIRLLGKYALVSRQPAESALAVHRLVHQALRQRLQVQGHLAQWTQRAIAQLLRESPNSDQNGRSKWKRLLPHAQFALSHSLSDQEGTDKEGTDKMNLAWKCALALLDDGRYKESEELFVQVLETHKRVLGANHRKTLTIMANLAVTYRKQGFLNKAQKLATHAMEARKTILGPEHPDTLSSMANVALIFWGQRRLEMAEHWSVQVMLTRKRVLGLEHPDTLSSMGNLAVIYIGLQKWSEADKLNAEVVQARKRVLGSDHRDTLISIGNQARIRFQQGRRREAEQSLTEVINVLKNVFGDEHPDTLDSMGNLAVVYSGQERWKEAEELSTKVIDTRKKVLGEKHPNTLRSMANLTSMYRDQGRWEEAEQLQVQMMQVKHDGQVS